jgi:nucleoside-diphosphate-sugar epimerase
MEYINNSDKILVVGGTGFIGHHLLKETIKRGFSCTSISLNLPVGSRKIEKVNYVIADINNKSELKSKIGDDYDYVVNLGGYPNHNSLDKGGAKIINSHFISVLNLLSVISRKKIKRFVQIGSSDEYGEAILGPQVETSREQPISPYSIAKVASTHFIQMLFRSEQFPGVTLRPFLIYGPGQDEKRFIPQVIKGCLSELKFPTSEGTQLRDFCHVNDAVNAIMLAMLSNDANGNIFNIGSGVPVTIRSVVELITKIINKGKPIFGEIPLRPGEAMNLYANIEFIQKVLNWEPKVGFQTGIMNAIDWYQKHDE